MRTSAVSPDYSLIAYIELVEVLYKVPMTRACLMPANARLAIKDMITRLFSHVSAPLNISHTQIALYEQYQVTISSTNWTF